MPDIGQSWKNCEINSKRDNFKNKFTTNFVKMSLSFLNGQNTIEGGSGARTRLYRKSCQLCLVFLIAFTILGPVSCRPQAVKIDTETGSRQDRRWDRVHEQSEDTTRDFRDNRDLQEAIMQVLETLPEEDLKLLEELPRLAYDELPQADMPMEDDVEDSVQELPMEDVPANPDLESYRGELVVLDNVNSTMGSGNSTGNGTVETSNDEASYPQLQKINRESVANFSTERNKEMRLQDIRQQILTYLFSKGTPPVLQLNSTNHQQMILRQELYQSVRERMQNHSTQFPPGEVYTEKVQSFYPSCYVPRNTDEELWIRGETMNLWFDLSQPPLLHGTSVNVVAAKLRLYKLSQDNVTVAVPEACPPPAADEASSEVSKSSKFHFTFPSSPYAVEDKQIRVSIYWYTRSLKKHRVKRKLLDSQMLSVYGESWTEWNIRGAVKAWKENGRNFGLAVEVEDEDGVLLPATKYFTSMNCSKQASISSPIPGFLARAIAESSSNKSVSAGKSHPFHFNTLLFPIIDLCTIESPESERSSFYQKIQDDSEKTYPLIFPSIKKENITFVLNTAPNASNETDKHRIRHRNHHHEETKPKKHIETMRRDDGDSIEEITWEDDLDGHQLRKKIIEQKIIKKPLKYQDNNDR